MKTPTPDSYLIFRRIIYPEVIGYVALIVLLHICVTTIQAQDPFATHFFNNKSIFNPAFTGSVNSMALNLSYKTQWNSDNSRPYNTAFVVYEEALPCQILDYGLRVLYDEEGDGILRTWEVGGMVAGSITGLSNKFDEHNLRIGLSFAWRQHNADFTRLIFSDQIDAKYGFTDASGNPIPSAFVPPDDNSSRIYFNPGVGVIWRSKWNNPKAKGKGILMNIGASAQNLMNLSGSILDDDQYDAWKFTFHADAKFVPIRRGRQFVTLQPTVLYQNQGTIDYLEVGLQTAVLNNGVVVGAFLHSNTGNGIIDNTNWFTINTIFNVRTDLGMNGKNLLAIGFSYSDNINRLKNFFGPQIQMSFSFNFASSIMCPNISYGADGPCPIWQVSPAKRKIYDNIWYEDWLL